MNPDNARPIRITAAAGTYLAGASSAGTLVRCSPLKAVYDADAFVPHAALLRQGFPHCAIFPTAASRRSLGRISVPMWPVGLSTRLPVVGLVGLYPANCLMGRDPIPRRRSFPLPGMRPRGDIRYQSPFRGAVPVRGAGRSRVTHPFATLCPPEGGLTVRLACVRHAASVHPEPGSNSPLKKSRAEARRSWFEKRNCDFPGGREPHVRLPSRLLHWLK